MSTDQTENSTRYRVGDLTVDTGTREIYRDGVLLSLPSLSFDLIVELSEAAPNLLTHDQLIERVWSGRIVSPETITQRIKLVRDALGDNAQQPIYIGLVRGQGYRMLAPVGRSETPAESVTVLASRIKPLAAALLLSVIAIGGWLLWPNDQVIDSGLPAHGARDTIAVLPFENLSGNDDDQYLSRGLGDDLRDRLSRTDGLRVVARLSSVATRDSGRQATEIATQLGASRLIEGRFTRTANVLDVSVSIVDGSNGLQLWNKSYRQTSRSLLQIQRQMTADLLSQLLPDGEPADNPGSDVSNLTAQDLMLLARHYELQVREEQTVDREKLLRAIDHYRQATEADPNSALAHSRLAGALLYNGDGEAAHGPILRALSLDPEQSEVQYTAGLYYLTRGLPGSGNAFQRAIELNPNNADALSARAWWIWHQGDNQVPEALYRQALELDPLSLSRHAALTNFYGWSGQPDKALSHIESIAARFSSAPAFNVIAKIYESTGAVDEAIAWAMKAHKDRPNSADAAWYLAELFAIVGDADTALSYEQDPGIGLLFYMRRYDDAIALGEEQMLFFPRDVQLKYVLAFAYNTRGLYAKASQLLEFTGLPDTFYSDTRDARAVEASVTLMESYFQSGNIDRAAELAARIIEFMGALIDTGNADWWPFVHSACAEIMLGRKQAALDRLSHVVNSRRIPRMPILLDSPCFQSVSAEPAYLNLIDSISSRQQELIARLPETLGRYGFPIPDTLAQRSE